MSGRAGLFACGALAVARHLPHGRHQAGIATSTSTETGTTSQARLEAARPIGVCANLWLGGGVMVCPGGGIGENTVVGAGDPVIDCYKQCREGRSQPDQGRELASARVG